MKSAVFLYNTQSGKCKIGHCTASICTVFRAYGYEIVPQPIDFEANPFDGNEQIDLMVVAGGDGTVNYVVNAMRNKGLDIPLGVIPAGTANDFAGALGMSHKPLEAAKQIASGAIDRVDCGCVNGLYFVNIFSFGIFTTTSQRTPDERKHKIGKLAYIIEGVKEFRAMHAVPLQIVADGQAFDFNSLMVLVFNGETAGGFRLARRSSIKPVRLPDARKEEFPAFDAGHGTLPVGRKPQDSPPLAGPGSGYRLDTQRTYGRRRPEGCRIPAAYRVYRRRPARDVPPRRGEIKAVRNPVADIAFSLFFM